MLYGLSIVFIPLFLGYFIKVSQQRWVGLINHVTTYSLYLILLGMGISLGQLDNLAEKLPQIGVTALLMSLIIHAFNLVSLMLYDKLSPFQLAPCHTQTLPSRLRLLVDSVKLAAMPCVGAVLGYFGKGALAFTEHLSTYALVIIIFCVGIQLRNSGIPLRDVFLNRRGIISAVIFMASSLVGGAVCAVWLDFSCAKGLAFASGFGWYSLSSVLINDAWGAVDGSIAFFNDLSREIFSLLAIPFFMRLFPTTAVGLGGATSLDFNLPIIQKSGGIQIVPLAISFGFIVNLATPLLLALFIAIA